MRYAISATSFAFVLGLGALLAQPAFAGGGGPAAPGTYMGDFNGDGRTDVLVTDSATGQVYVYITAAGIPTTANVDIAESSLLTTLPAGAAVKGVGDFNSDDHADILVETSAAGLAVLLGDATVGAGASAALTSASFFVGLPVGWSVSGVGDANDDGMADVLVTHTDGTVYTYITELPAGAPQASAAASGLPVKLPVGWGVSTVGDLNGDGRSDFVAQGPSSGVISPLYNFITGVGGIAVDQAASDSPGGVPDGYGCCAAGDTTPATVSSDLAIIDETGSNPGLTYVYVTNADGVSFDAAASTNNVVLPAGWTVEGFADFNNDGIADTLAVNTDGAMIVFLNSGPGSVVDSPFLTSLPAGWATANYAGMSAAE